MFTDFTETLPPPRPARPPGTAEDWTIPQRWEHFGAEEHRVWDSLYARQRRKLAGRAVAAFEHGLDSLLLSRSGIPDFDDLNERLFARSGWTVVAVPGPAARTRSSSPISPAASSPPAISSAPPPASIIWRSRTSSTTCSATSRCSPSPGSPTSCSGSARKG